MPTSTPLSTSNSKGFTLIELLVVIAILAILSIIGLVSYSTVQKSGRDAIRRDQIQTIANAIEAKKGTDGTYIFAQSDLRAEFPDPSLLTTAYAGKDPSLTEYCVSVSPTTTPPSAPVTTTAWNVTTTPALCVTANSWTALNSGIAVASNAKAWTICTRLETTSTVFCRQSLSR